MSLPPKPTPKLDKLASWGEALDQMVHQLAQDTVKAGFTPDQAHTMLMSATAKAIKDLS
jgi:hypothetical protein